MIKCASCERKGDFKNVRFSTSSGTGYTHVKTGSFYKFFFILAKSNDFK